MLTRLLKHLVDGGTLAREEARVEMDRLLFEAPPTIQVAAFLALLQGRQATAEELAGFADALAAAALPFPAEPGAALDTCGTGGDGRHTFNISTVAALVAAAAGATVLKHGNRAATSHSGSADLLEALGAPVALQPAQAVECSRRHRFAFLFARQYHPVLARLAPVRAELGIPTVFNLLGPLLNPARVRRQVVGVYAPAFLPRVAEALRLRGTEHAIVLHGTGGLDEATPLGPFRLLRVRQGRIEEEERDARDLGIPRCRLQDLGVDSPGESARVAEAVLAGAAGPPRDTVLLNAALALEVADVAQDAGEGLQRAAEAVDSGAARDLLERLRAFAPAQEHP